MFAWIALGALVTGCLSTPGPAQSADDDGGNGDGGGGDGSGAGDGGNGDGGEGPRCRPAGALPAGQDWPPPAIVVRHLQIADIDVDGIDDLIVSVAPEAAQTAGASKIYVLYGPVDRADPKFHASLDVSATASVMPWATTLARIDGDECLDLVVAGPPVMGSSTSYVAVWRHAGAVTPWSGPAVRSALTREPPPGPLLALLADLTIDSDRDLVVADLNNVDLFVGATVTTLPGALRVTPPGQLASPNDCDSWGNINALAVQPAAGGRERLVAIGHYRFNTVTVDAGGTITTSNTCQENTTPPITRGSVAFNLDGNAPLDVVSGGGGWIGAHLLGGTSAPVSVPQGASACIDTPRGSDDYVEGFSVGDLGGLPAPEVVIIDHDDANGMSYACLLDAVTVTPQAVSRAAVNELSLGNGVVRNVAVGDVDGATRAWILMRDGDLKCLQRGAAANLEACQ